MPRKEDLHYLAHVREVETNNKETWSLLKEGKFSVVICNRFPETQAKASEEKDWGIVNTVCLVSLEGWGDCLNNPDVWMPRRFIVCWCSAPGASPAREAAISRAG